MCALAVRWCSPSAPGAADRVDGAACAPPGFARRFFAEALDRELLLRPIGNTVYTMPPYIVSEAEIAHLASQTAAALEASLG